MLILTIFVVAVFVFLCNCNFRWYTSMIGRKINLKLLEADLRKANVINIRTTEFFQGKTTRWAIAWTFSQDGLSDLVVSFFFIN